MIFVESYYNNEYLPVPELNQPHRDIGLIQYRLNNCSIAPTTQRIWSKHLQIQGVTPVSSPPEQLIPKDPLSSLVCGIFFFFADDDSLLCCVSR